MKILVAYVSGFGATAEVAKEIADILGASTWWTCARCRPFVRWSLTTR